MIGEHGNEFDERNVFLHVALGLLAASRRVDGVLVKYGRPASRTAANTPEDVQLIEFMLGVISFRNNVVLALDSARDGARPAQKVHVVDMPLQEPLR